MLRQPSPDGASLLWPEVKGKVFLILVEKAQLRALVGVYDGKDLRDRFAQIVTIANTPSVILSAKPVPLFFHNRISFCPDFAFLFSLSLFYFSVLRLPASSPTTFFCLFKFTKIGDAFFHFSVIRNRTYILVSLEEAPPAIFCTRS